MIGIEIRLSEHVPRDEAWIGYATRKVELTPSGIRVAEDFRIAGKIINLSRRNEQRREE